MGGVWTKEVPNVESLMHAAIIGDKDKIQELIEAGADVNALVVHTAWRDLWDPSKRYGETALMITAEMGFDDCMDLLLKAGADVNITGHCGHTALQVAVKKNNIKCVQRLIQAGADVNYNLSGTCALFHAARNGYHRCVNILIQNGADVNIQDINGLTPLMMASCLCEKSAPVLDRVKCMELILLAGANVNRINTFRKNTLTYFLYNQSGLVTMDIVLLLYAAGETKDDATVLPEYLQQTEIKLKHLCRVAIRKHLVNLSPVNLFIRIPQLRLPSILIKYLLYGKVLNENTEMNDILLIENVLFIA